MEQPALRNEVRDLAKGLLDGVGVGVGGGGEDAGRWEGRPPGLSAEKQATPTRSAASDPLCTSEDPL